MDEQPAIARPLAAVAGQREEMLVLLQELVRMPGIGGSEAEVLKVEVEVPLADVEMAARSLARVALDVTRAP